MCLQDEKYLFSCFLSELSVLFSAAYEIQISLGFNSFSAFLDFPDF